MTPYAAVALGVPALMAARLRMHAAAQWLARLARSYAIPASDDSHTALTWDGEGLRLFSHPLTIGTTNVTASLTVRDLELRLTRGAADVGGILLSGQTDTDRRDAVLDLAAAAGADPDRFSTALPYPAPPPPGWDAPDPDAANAWCDLWTLTHAALSAVCADTPNASPIRLWPHHFDMATLISHGGARSVGLGLAVADDLVDAPYFYTAPWPAPPRNALSDAPAPWSWRAATATALVLPAFPLAHTVTAVGLANDFTAAHAAAASLLEARS